MDFSIIRSFNNRKFYSLTPEKIYNVPPKATHVHIYNGYIAFGESKDKSLPVLKIKKTKRGRFVRIPPGISSIQFPKYFSARKDTITARYPLIPIVQNRQTKRHKSFIPRRSHKASPFFFTCFLFLK